MPRLLADVRIGRKKRGGATHRIALVRQPVGRRYWVRRDGKYSTKVLEARTCSRSRASVDPVAADLFGRANAVLERLDRAGGVLGDGVFVEL